MDNTFAEESAAAGAPPFSGDIPRALEAIFMIADEPQTLVSLATAVGAPMAAVRGIRASVVRRRS